MNTRGDKSERTSKPARARQLGKLAARFGLHINSTDGFRITRRPRGDSLVYYDARGRRITDKRTIRRLASLAVPPAYRDVRYAEDEAAHLQAVGRDAAGRLQYRYHPAWTNVREARKARQLGDLIKAMPRIRRAVTRCLAGCKPTRELALAAVIELVSVASIRAGRERHARTSGARGAATLLKSNLKLAETAISLNFKAKGGRAVSKQITAPRLVAAVRVLNRLPGRRLFQYRSEDGRICVVRAREVNDYLRAIGGVDITLKDFRTLCACTVAVETLSRTQPARAVRKQKQQIREVVKQTAHQLGNTPAVCRKSYIHQTVIDAFEAGTLAPTGNGQRREKGERILAQLIST